MNGLDAAKIMNESCEIMVNSRGDFWRISQPQGLFEKFINDEWAETNFQTKDIVSKYRHLTQSELEHFKEVRKI